MVIYQKIVWQEKVNDFTIDCELDIAIHTKKSNTILLIVPGIDGSVDGYMNKYVTIAENIVTKHNAAVVRMPNPFIGSDFWQSNIRVVLQFIEDNAKDICGSNSFKLKIVAHSIGAYVVGELAWEYPFIDSVLLINPATGLDMQPFTKGLASFDGDPYVVIGSKDPAAERIDVFEDAELSEKIYLITIDGADHHFSGEHFNTFITLPSTVLFK